MESENIEVKTIVRGNKANGNKLVYIPQNVDIQVGDAVVVRKLE